MPIDPLAAALRRDAALLLEFAPPTNAAAAWHAVRAAQARRISWIMTLSGWGLRLLLVLAGVALAMFDPRTLLGAAIPLLLVGWLSSGICPPFYALRRERLKTPS